VKAYKATVDNCEMAVLVDDFGMIEAAHMHQTDGDGHDDFSISGTSWEVFSENLTRKFGYQWVEFDPKDMD